MKTLLNTLYLTKQGLYAHLDNETISLEYDNKRLQKIPLHHISSIVTFGNILLSPYLIGKCAKEGREIALFDINGRFWGRIDGATSGNILLRQAQCKIHNDTKASLSIAKAIIASKIRNSKTLLMRRARDSKDKASREIISKQAEHLKAMLNRLKRAKDIDEARGIEGESARAYFLAFSYMITPSLRELFLFKNRNRRPPRDEINALLSFLYTLLRHDCVSALEGVGLDSREGFLHTIRPGRPSLGLDLMEEFRAQIADRLAINLINLKQLKKSDFEHKPGGVVYLNENGKKTLIIAYQKLKQETIIHPLFKDRVEIGLLPHIQARVMARYIRGDIPFYQPMIFK